MENNMQHFQQILPYYFKRGKNTTETQKKICVVYGASGVSDQTCQEWFAKFHAANFLLDSAPWLGRLVEAGSDQIEILIEIKVIPQGR